MRIRHLVLAVLLCAGWQSTAVGARISSYTDPAHCSVTARFVVCPAGDVTYDVVVRDQNWFPMAGVGVWLDFSGCANLQLCPGCCAGVTIDPVARTGYAATNALGAVHYSLRMGGVCNGSTISVSAALMPWDTSPGVLLARSAVSSPDQNGDLDVDAADVAVVSAAIGTINWGADFDGDGRVTLSDLAWLTNNHIGHSCTGVVPARTPTWGGLKLLYR
jgi:hypothetical protein